MARKSKREEAVPAQQPKKPTRGQRLVAHLKGRGDGRLSTDEIMALMRGEPASE